MKRLFEKEKLNLIMGIFYLIIGVVTVVISFTNPGIISQVLSYSVAVALFLSAFISLITSLLKDKKSIFTPALALSSILVAIGVVLCVKTGLIGDIIVYFMSVFAIALGVIELAKAIQFINLKYKVIYIILCFFIAALGIAFGIFALIKPGMVLNIIYIIVGVFLITIGITNIIASSKKK